MNNEEVKNFISSIQPDTPFDETGKFLNVEYGVAGFRNLLVSLRQQGFDLQPKEEEKSK